MTATTAACISWCEGSHTPDGACHVELVWLPDDNSPVALVGQRGQFQGLDFNGPVMDLAHVRLLHTILMEHGDQIALLHQAYVLDTDGDWEHTDWCTQRHKDNAVCDRIVYHQDGNTVVYLEVDSADVYLTMTPVLAVDGGAAEVTLGLAGIAAVVPQLPVAIEAMAAVQESDVDHADAGGPFPVLRSPATGGRLTLFHDPHHRLSAHPYFVAWTPQPVDWHRPPAPIVDVLQDSDAWILTAPEALQFGGMLERLAIQADHYPIGDLLPLCQDWSGPLPITYQQYPLPSTSDRWEDQQQGMLCGWLFFDHEGMFVGQNRFLIVVWPGIGADHSWQSGELRQLADQQSNHGMFKEAAQAHKFGLEMVHLAASAPP